VKFESMLISPFVRCPAPSSKCKTENVASGCSRYVPLSIDCGSHLRSLNRPADGKLPERLARFMRPYIPSQTLPVSTAEFSIIHAPKEINSEMEALGTLGLNRINRFGEARNRLTTVKR
jgi:hypothetical protein